MNMGQQEGAKTVITDEQMVPAIEWVAEQMPGGFFVYRADDSQEIVYVNQATYRIFGCDSAEEFRKITGNTFYGMVHPDDFPRIQQSIDQQIADSTNENMDYVEYRIIRRDGSIRWVDDYGHFAHLPGYGDVYYVFIGDITEKHLAQEENRRRANIYGGMMAQFNVFADDSLSMMRLDLTTGIVEEVRGHDCYTQDRVGGKIMDSFRIRAEHFLLDGDRTRYQELFLPEHLMERYRRGAEHSDFVAYCRRQSGRQCFVKFSVSVTSDPESGDLIALYSETEYNTEQVTEVLGKKVLARQYDMVAYMIGAHYGVVIGDPADSSKGSIFPKTRDGNYDQYIEEQVIPAVDTTKENPSDLRTQLSLAQIWHHLDTEEAYIVEMSCLIDGESYYKRFSFYPVDRDMSFYILLKEDLTEVIQRERAQSERLSDALRKAEEASQAKSNFLSNMSHEIRTPITAILGMNEMIQRESNDEEVLGYADNIEKAGISLLGIISDILDFSKIEAGHMELICAEFEMTNLIGDLVNLTRFKAEEKGLMFRLEADPALPRKLCGDELRIKQIVTNLLTNAVKYTEKGSVTLTFRLTQKQGSRAALFVSVTDTGIGIRNEEREKLFSAFDRLDVIRTRTIEGTGLGLAITTQLLSMMGSTLSVESTYGEGSCFSFVLDLEIADAAPIGAFEPLKPDAENRVSHRKSAGFRAPGARVLIVDDTPMNLQVIAGLLKHTDMQIDTALSGMECIERFGNADYDLVFLDYRMPEMDGIETLKKLREKYPQKSEKTPVISLTASAISGDRERMLDAGFSDYLSKPVNIRNMEDMLRKYLGDKVQEIETEKKQDDSALEPEELRILPAELFAIPELSTEKGIEFCGDAEDYLDVLAIYAGSVPEKAAEIARTFAEGDLDGFTNLVHSLKSTSRAIGAEALSMRALELEQNGRERNLELIKEKLPQFLEDYRAMAEKLAFLA